MTLFSADGYPSGICDVTEDVFDADERQCYLVRSQPVGEYSVLEVNFTATGQSSLQKAEVLQLFFDVPSPQLEERCDRQAPDYSLQQIRLHCPFLFPHLPIYGSVNFHGHLQLQSSPEPLLSGFPTQLLLYPV